MNNFNKRSVLICTTGTSLFESNLKKLDETISKENDINKKNLLIEIKNFFQNKNWENLARLMQAIKPEDRICGAEINTIEEYIKRNSFKNEFSLQKIFFLVSDTEDGRNTGEFLVHYYLNRKDLKFKNGDIDFFIIKDLQDKDPKKFKLNGLRNLVGEIAKIARNYGINNIAIDATGGYKAQIAVAVIIGQALNIPVYYKHERFSEIIDFVPLPVSLNYDLLGKYSYKFTELINNNCIPYDENFIEEEDNQKLQIFFEIEEIDNIKYISLTPLGYLYVESFKLKHPGGVNLEKLDEKIREKPSFTGDHFPSGFKDFVNKVYNENRWIKTCKSLPYINQKSIKGIGFYIYNDCKEKKLVGTYSDKDNFGARFRIILSDETNENLIWAASYLNEKYKN